MMDRVRDTLHQITIPASQSDRGRKERERKPPPPPQLSGSSSRTEWCAHYVLNCGTNWRAKLRGPVGSSHFSSELFLKSILMADFFSNMYPEIQHLKQAEMLCCNGRWTGEERGLQCHLLCHCHLWATSGKPQLKDINAKPPPGSKFIFHDRQPP